MRFAGPLLMLGVALASFVSLQAGGDEVFVLVGLDRVVGIDPRAQAALTWKLCGAVGRGWGLWALRAKPQGDAALDE